MPQSFRDLPDGSQAAQVVVVVPGATASAPAALAPGAGADGATATSVPLDALGLINAAGTVDRLHIVSGGIPLASDQVLYLLLVEARVQTTLLIEGLNLRADPDEYRAAVMAQDLTLN